MQKCDDPAAVVAVAEGVLEDLGTAKVALKTGAVRVLEALASPAGP